MARVQVIRTEPKCKLCRNEQRDRIDALLLSRSQGAHDVDGRRVNIDYVKEKLAEWGVPNPTDENVKVHWRKHCEVISDEVFEAAEAATSTALAAIAALDGEELTDADAAVNRVIAVGRAQLEARVAAGDANLVSVDQMMKAVEVKTRRKADEGVNNLLTQLGAGVASVMVKQAEKQAELPAPDLELTADEVAEVE